MGINVRNLGVCFPPKNGSTLAFHPLASALHSVIDLNLTARRRLYVLTVILIVDNSFWGDQCNKYCNLGS